MSEQGNVPDPNRASRQPASPPLYSSIRPPAGPPPAPYYAVPRTNGFAIAAMVCGIVWAYGIGAILGLVFGYKARKEIDESGGTQQGRGMATAGIVLGWIGVAGLAAVIIIMIAAVATTQDPSSYGS